MKLRQCSRTTVDTMITAQPTLTRLIVAIMSVLVNSADLIPNPVASVPQTFVFSTKMTLSVAIISAFIRMLPVIVIPLGMTNVQRGLGVVHRHFCVWRQRSVIILAI